MKEEVTNSLKEVQQKIREIFKTYFSFLNEVWVLWLILPPIFILLVIKAYINYKRVSAALHSAIDIVVIERKKDMYLNQADLEVARLYKTQKEMEEIPEDNQSDREVLANTITQITKNIEKHRNNAKAYEKLLEKETQNYLSYSI